MQLGTAGMHQQVQLWLTRYRYLTRLVDKLVKESFVVYLTSDHGNVWARGIGRPSERELGQLSYTFPFDLLPFVNDVRLSERFEVTRQGLDLEMVAAGMTRR